MDSAPNGQNCQKVKGIGEFYVLTVVEKGPFYVTLLGEGGSGGADGGIVSFVIVSIIQCCGAGPILTGSG